MAVYSGSDQKNLTKCEICLNLMRSSTGQQRCKARNQVSSFPINKQPILPLDLFTLFERCPCRSYTVTSERTAGETIRTEMRGRAALWTIEPHDGLSEKSIAWLCAHGSVSGLRNNLSVTEEYLEGFDILCYLTAVPRAQDIRMDSPQGWVSVWERSSEETPAKLILSITPLLSTTEESPAGAAQSQGPFFYMQNILPSTHASAQSGIYLYKPFFKIKNDYLNDI